jgi:rare lipoprotein A
MRRIALFALAAALLFTAACARKKHAPATASAPSPGWSESGIASWYGNPYHGRATSSGEIYDMDQLTAAHRTLPYGAIVRVTNLTNQRKVEVRINDRGPFIDGRIIDVSRAAARSINLIGPGTARVRLDLLSYDRAPSTRASYAVQLGRFLSADDGERLRRQLGKHYTPIEVFPRPSAPGEFVVRLARVPSESEAREIVESIRRDWGPAFVVRVEPPSPR